MLSAFFNVALLSVITRSFFSGTLSRYTVQRVIAYGVIVAKCEQLPGQAAPKDAPMCVSSAIRRAHDHLVAGRTLEAVGGVLMLTLLTVLVVCHASVTGMLLYCPIIEFGMLFESVYVNRGYLKTVAKHSFEYYYHICVSVWALAFSIHIFTTVVMVLMQWAAIVGYYPEPFTQNTTAMAIAEYMVTTAYVLLGVGAARQCCCGWATEPATATHED